MQRRCQEPFSGGTPSSGGPELLVSFLQQQLIRREFGRGRQDDPTIVNPLQAMKEHRPVFFFHDILTHLNNVVRTNGKQIGIEAA